MARWQSRFLLCVAWCCYQTWAYPGPGLNPGLNRTRRAVHCNTDLEYLHGDLCCRNCPAGTYLKTPCSSSGGHSECEECGPGTYTELGHGLKKCLSCSLCRPDQEVVHQCISTHNTECQCKPGGFCAPDQACEICKRCARCGEDEIVVRNCTPTSNTECKKKPPDPEQASDPRALYIFFGLGFPLCLIFVVLLVVCALRRKQKTSDSGSSSADQTTGCNGTEASLGPSPRCWSLVRSKLPVVDLEEQRGLCEAPASTSNSQDNLITSLPLYTCSAPAQSSCAPALTLPYTRIEEPQFNIVPVNGQVSLKSCFEFFEELDVHYHNRFFRHLGLSDNVIKSKESLVYVDRVHDLLYLWMEKRGREASLQDLLKALMDLNQRRTAEIIVERAVGAGHFVYE
ncbi:tumor necrosis factor receptor superfamily member 6-like isoform X1 [Boleophthalmus pectinirostris]|uniref:tumor necrosis factor receptor superfamily member 6-like isoform X1 n=1 Tax=Boleophthalmus pectinirostris TaxID=150288 RepID=UPI0024316BB3|nr:tumor necrosis factor receptor superfamily member 6-like isoform X1 [Boleophthalmus pectinirostris]